MDYLKHCTISWPTSTYCTQCAIDLDHLHCEVLETAAEWLAVSIFYFISLVGTMMTTANLIHLKMSEVGLGRVSSHSNMWLQSAPTIV